VLDALDFALQYISRTKLQHVHLLLDITFMRSSSGR
jgi:hypothetical protein